MTVSPGEATKIFGVFTILINGGTIAEPTTTVALAISVAVNPLAKPVAVTVLVVVVERDIVQL